MALSRLVQRLHEAAALPKQNHGLAQHLRAVRGRAGGGRAGGVGACGRAGRRAGVIFTVATAAVTTAAVINSTWPLAARHRART